MDDLQKIEIIYETLDGSRWSIEDDGVIEITVPIGSGDEEYVTLTRGTVEKMLEVMIDFEKTKG